MEKDRVICLQKQKKWLEHLSFGRQTINIFAFRRERRESTSGEIKRYEQGPCGDLTICHINQAWPPARFPHECRGPERGGGP